jgi:hypothetical protein
MPSARLLPDRWLLLLHVVLLLVRLRSRAAHRRPSGCLSP